MNKIYKVIWSKAKNCYVVVSEIAKIHTRNTTKVDRRRKVGAGLALAAVALSCNFWTATPVEAADIKDEDGVVAIKYGSYATTSTATGQRAIAWGLVTTASGTLSTAWGRNTTASGVASTALGTNTFAYSSNSLTWGSETVAGISNNQNIYNATAWGSSTAATNSRATAYGFRTYASGQQATSFGSSTVAGAYKYNGVEAYVKIDHNSFIVYRKSDNVAIGSTTLHELSRMTNPLLTQDNTYQDQTAFGKETTASGGQATAFGGGTKATNWRSTAWGKSTLASGSDATAFGTSTIASKNNSTAFGESAKAMSANSTSFGKGTIAGAQLNLRGGKISYLTDPTQNTTNLTLVKKSITRSGLEDDYGSNYDHDYGGGRKKDVWVFVDENGVTLKGFDPDSKYGESGYGDYQSFESDTGELYYLKYTDALDALDVVATSSGRDNATAWGEYSMALGQNSTAFGVRSFALADNATAFGHETRASGKRATSFGINTHASGRNSTAFGYLTEASGENSTSFGSNTQAVGGGATAFGAFTQARAENSTAWGLESKVSGGKITIGGNEYNDLETKRYDDLSSNFKPEYYLTGKDSNGNTVKLGGRKTDSEVVDGGYKYRSQKDYPDYSDDNDVADYNAAINNPKTWIGEDQTVRTIVDEWIKSNNGEVSGQYSTAFGYQSEVYAKNALGALGGKVQAGAENSTAIGEGATVSSTHAHAMGNKAAIETGSAGSVALGGGIYKSNNNKLYSDIKIQKNDNGEFELIGIGVDNARELLGTFSTQEGAKNAKDAKIIISQIGKNSMNSFAAIGGKVGNGATDAIAIGGAISNSAKSAISIGQGSKASVANAVALGSDSLADRKAMKSYATSGYDVVTGKAYEGEGKDSATWKSTLASVSIGEEGKVKIDAETHRLTSSATKTRQITGVAAGSAETDAVNVAQLRTAAEGLRISSDNRAVAAKTDTYGRQEIVSPYIVIAGINSAEEKDYSKVWIQEQKEPSGAFGFGTEVTGKNSYSLGNKNKIGHTGQILEVQPPVYNSISANNSFAIGNEITIDSDNSFAIGNSAYVGQADSAIVIGNEAKAGAELNDIADNAIVIGTSASASVSEGVALGSKSKATTKAGAEGYDVMGTDHSKDTSGVWKSTEAAVSIGDATNTSSPVTRQITDLAAGTELTDAVNVAQLKQLQWNIGTGTVDISTPTFLAPVGGNKNNVVLRAGDGVKISATERTNGYDIEVKALFSSLETTVPGGNYIDSITYNGRPYYISGSGSGIVDAVSDNRAVIVAPETEDIKNESGEVTGKKHYLKIHSPYINVHGLNGTEFYDEPQDYFALAQKSGALAIGIHSKAAEENSTAIGHNADAMGSDSTAIGYNSHAHGDNSVAVGVAATTSGNRAISIGTSASHTSNEDYNPTNPHQGARAAGQGTIVLGDRAMAISSEYQADNKYVEKPGPDYTVNDAIAIGTRAQARARNGIALGGNTSYTYYDEENKQYITVYGSDDDVLGGRNNGAEVGDSAVSGIAIGGAYGKFNEDTKTIHQEMAAAATFGIRGIAIGSGALVANSDDFADLKEALSDPNYVKIKRDFLTARSNHLEAKADWDAIKDLTVNDPSMPEGMRITQIKYDAAREKYERTLQVMNDATAKYSMALKEVVRLQAKDAVLEEDAIAIGTLSNASIKDSVALGSKSITDANDKAGSRTGMSGYDPLGKASNNDLFRGDSNYSEDDPVWRSTAGSLSVGGTYYKKDDNGEYVTDADGNLVVDEVITRRISHVAAGIKDSDAVNVAQLKRATTLSSDGRNTALGIDESGNMIVNSPFLAISGVQESSENNSIVRKYRNDGGADGYVKGLQAESTEIEGRIASIKKTQSDIDKALNGYYDNNGNFVDGIEQQYAKRQNLEKQFKDGQITPEKYLEESAKLITETDYRAHKMEYTDQLTATNERLSALNDSKQEYDELLANNGEKAKTKYKEAETYFNSQANASGTDSMALGKEAKAGGKQSVVLGTGNEVGTAGDIDNNDSENVKANREKEATRSIAIGSNNKIKGNANTESSTDSIAFGTDNEIYGSQNTAIGTGHKMYGEKSGTMGDPNVLAANYSYVIGNDNTIGSTKYENGDEIKNQNIFIMGNENVIPEGQNHVYVLGSGVFTTTNHSVFLGDHSGYVEDDGTTTKGTTEGYKEATVSGIKFGDFAGGDENQVAGVVSVGGNVDGVMTTRRIQNVAPGLISAESTDAINGSQLYQAIKALTVDVQGDGTTTDVEKTASYGGGGGSTAATTYTVKGSVTTAEGSDNITVTDTKKEEKDPKSYNYKVELNPDITVESVTAGTDDNKTVLNKDGLVINDGPSVKKNGIDAAGTTITNVGSGLGGDSNAANISDVKALTTEVADGDNTTVTSETDDNGRKTFKVNLKNHW